MTTSATSADARVGGAGTPASIFTSVVGDDGEEKAQSQAGQIQSGGLPGEDTVREASKILLCSLCAVSALEGADMALLPAVFFALQGDLGLTLGNLATMSLVQGVTGSAVAPFWGIVADRGIMKRKNIITFGCVMQGLVTMALAFIDDFLLMTCLRALNGVFLASLRPVASGIIADVTSESRRGKVFGLVQLSTNVGMMAGGLLGTPISTKTVFGLQGWRVAFLAVGALSIGVGLFAFLTMVEPPREGNGGAADGKTQKGACGQEARKLLGYFRMPTFCALVFQGWFGGIPWSAMGYSTLFYQVGGLRDSWAAILGATGQAAGACGGLLGGLIGDRLAKRWPHHGRPLTAQISVMAGIPVAYLTFMVDPPANETAAFVYYLSLVIFLGLTATWCGVGVNMPILTEIVKPEGRSTILAWESALESTFSVILGNAMVGFLAETCFGYDLANAHEGSEHTAHPESRRALGKALTMTCQEEEETEEGEPSSRIIVVLEASLEREEEQVITI